MDVVALESIRALQKVDSSNEYVIFTQRGKDRTCLPERGNIEVVTVPGVSYADWEQIQLPIAVRNSGVDVLHCTANTAPLNCPVPLVVTIHDIIYLEKTFLDMKTASFYQRMGHIYRKWNVPRIMQRADRIITVSEFERRRIQDHCPGIGHKLDVVYNGVGEQFFSFQPDWKQAEIRTKYGLPQSFILFLGNRDPKKNTGNVFRAYVDYAASTPGHLPLVVVDFDKQEIRRMLKNEGHLDLAGSIYTVGYVAPVDMPTLYGLATVFLYPSLRESFGLPILEAMAASTPVITSDRASMPEISGNAAVLIDPDRPEHLAQMIGILTRDQSLRNRLVSRGRDRAAKFSWAMTADRLRSIYATVAGHGHVLRSAS